jgi:sugar phosphate isomerase/epimerase
MRGETRAWQRSAEVVGVHFDCPEGARFAQPRATPWVSGTVWKSRRPNGPTVRRTVGPLGRQWAFERRRLPRALPWAGRTAGPSARWNAAPVLNRKDKGGAFHLVLRAFAAWLICSGVVGTAAENKAAATPFYAFDNGTGYGRVPPDQQAAMLKELGYDGIAFSGARKVPEMLTALDARGLKMFSIYVDVCLTPEKGKPVYDPALKTAIEQLKGRGTQIWLPISGGTPSATDLDDQAVAVVREIADMAEKSELQVVLYPHFDMYVERIENALRLAKKIDRTNVGVAFNLCHFLRVDDAKNLDRRLKEAGPRLMAVSINGADGGDTNRMDWNRLIQTLDRGSYDVGQVLKALRRAGYAGPIGLQCYGVLGDSRENLKRSMKAWREIQARTAAVD